MLIGGAQPWHEPQMSQSMVRSVDMLWRGDFADFAAIKRGDLDPNFQNLSRPYNFSSEIARDRAEIPVDWWCAVLPRAAEVPEHCAERRHDVARRILPQFGPKILNFFRSRKFFCPQSREITAISLWIFGAQSCHEPQRSLSTVPSVGILWRGVIRRDLSRSGPKILKFFRGCKFSCPKSREITAISLSIGGAQSYNES